MSRVAIVRCEDYDSGRVEESVNRLLELMGGAETHLPPGKHLLLKPNLLKGAHPTPGAPSPPISRRSAPSSAPFAPRSGRSRSLSATAPPGEVSGTP
ncbi:MAG: hypothetical protein QGI11_10145 [Nitrospinota bacterium]|nr:hypothetical protein [Nitrospinota bacterium]MDP7504356.1 hypothetical protein [Nitrospinota bacterium]